MAVDDSTLIDEITALLESPDRSAVYQYTLTFLLDGDEYPAMRLIEMQIDRDYTTHLGDAIMAECQVDAEAYHRYLRPGRDRLEVRVERTQVIGAELPPESAPPEPRRYQAIIHTVGDEMREGNTPAAQTPKAQGMMGFRTLVVQLIPLSLEYVRKKLIGGVFPGITPGMLLKGLLTHTALSQPIEEAYRVKGVDMVPPTNQQGRESIVLPHGTRVSTLHRTLQEDHGGIYQTGIASYIQDDRWYVFPPYHTGRYPREPRSLTLVNLPPNRAPMVEQTWRLKDKTVVALLTDHAKEIDDTEYQELNHGNGVVYQKASPVMEGFIQTESNKSKAQKTQNVRQYGIRPRRNESNYQVFSDTRITDNDCHPSSQLARRNGRHFIATWHNADPELVYPGMPVRLLTVHGDELIVAKTAYGVVTRADHQILMKGRGLNATTHTCLTALTVFLERDEV